MSEHHDQREMYYADQKFREEITERARRNNPHAPPLVEPMPLAASVTPEEMAASLRERLNEINSLMAAMAKNGILVEVAVDYLGAPQVPKLTAKRIVLEKRL